MNIYIGAYCETETRHTEVRCEETFCSTCDTPRMLRSGMFCSQCGGRMSIVPETRKILENICHGYKNAPSEHESFDGCTYYFPLNDLGSLYSQDGCDDWATIAIDIDKLTSALTNFEKRYSEFWQHLRDNGVKFRLTAGVLIY